MIEKKVLTIIQSFLTELGNERAVRALNANASLDKDLGLGSIERVELLTRLEKEFNLRLPQKTLLEINSVSQLIAVLEESSTSAQMTREKLQKTVVPIPEIAEASIPVDAKTLVEVLENYAGKLPNRPHIYLHKEEGEEEVITYGELFKTASHCAQGLLDRGIKPKDTVVLMLPTDKAFFFAFFGALLAGGIPAPVYPPIRRDQIEEYVKRQVGILNNAQAKFLITNEEISIVANLLKPLVPSLNAVLKVDQLIEATYPELHRLTILPEDPALIQYTSGSTDVPKGVLLTHQNLLANIRAFGAAMEVKPQDVVVSWLPLYHDMGLIGAWLGSLYFGTPVVIMSPFMFLLRPERWLWAIHYHRATLSAAPNFAYELCVKKIADEDIEGLDLKCWRLALNGAEAVRPVTLERFIKRFEPYGFSKTTLLPVYGLAESSVALAFPPIPRKPLIDRIERKILESSCYAQQASAHDKNALEFVSCGKPLTGLTIRLLDEVGNVISDDRVVGHLQFKGTSVTSGYFNAPEKNKEIFHDGWCDSGDYAYRVDGEYYITGRLKDIIIKAGRNYYPQELESATEQVEGIRKGCVVSFGVVDESTGTENMIIVAEIQDAAKPHQEKIIAQVIEQVTLRIGIPPDEVILVAPHVIPKTSSGKLRRFACKKKYLNHDLVPKHRPTAMQFVRMQMRAIFPRIKQLLKKLKNYMYTAYCILAFAMISIPFWLRIRLLPQKDSSDNIMHTWARLFLRVIGCKLTVEGLANLDKNKPMILAPNHASYLDVIMLMAAIPYKILFVAKKELSNVWGLRTFLARQKYILVDRTDLAHSQLELQEISTALQQGETMLIFPEATFTRAIGIRPFKLGAFKIAVETQVPICPIAIRGTRYMMPSGRWTIRRGKINIIMTEPMYPKSNDFSEVTRLRDETRARLIKLAEEPALDLIAAGFEEE